jgi:predicted phage-related endonuclease
LQELYEFHLLKSEIDLLESNLKEIKNPIENVIKGGAAGYIPHPDLFVWLSASLKKTIK